MSVEDGQLARWRHTDSDPARSMAAALSTDDYGALTAPERVRRLRALAIGTVYAVENLRVLGVQPPGEMEDLTLGGEVTGAHFATREHNFAASTIARTLQLFADPGRHVLYDATTHDGDPAKVDAMRSHAFDAGEAGLPPLLIGAVIVIAIAAFSAAACYCGQAAAEVVDRKLTEDTLTARMMVTQGRAIALVDEHTARERAAGHPIPWSPQESRLLESLLETQKRIATRSHTALPNPFPGAVEAGAEVGRRIADTGIGLGVFALIAAGAYVLTR